MKRAEHDMQQRQGSGIQPRPSRLLAGSTTGRTKGHLILLAGWYEVVSTATTWKPTENRNRARGQVQKVHAATLPWP